MYIYVCITKPPLQATAWQDGLSNMPTILYRGPAVN